MPLDSMTIGRTISTHAARFADQLFAVPLLDVVSSNVGRVGYDDEAERLYVQFRDRRAKTRDGAVYAYERVPNAIFEAIMQADEDADGSVGSTFHRLVKTAGFKFSRV